MVATIHLYNETAMPRDKINYEVANDVLTQELNPKRVSSKTIPKNILC